ncbi:hypothetical protein [Paenibacillus sp. FSL L8-0463]|uniref:hypothetical protein n=1 Tax=Paenibacillus sp. FSL L8-0463 TaxID=2954687 RepID=UPI00311A313D
MTNEEAIHAIKCNYPPENYSRLREALDMAMLLLAAAPAPLINWIPYDQANPPEYGDDKQYFVCNGKYADVAGFHKFADDDQPEWYLPDCCALNGNGDVTHYAHINLPGRIKQMNRPEVEGKEAEWKKVLRDMKDHGVITSAMQKSLNGKVSVWCYDQTHIEVGEDTDNA